MKNRDNKTELQADLGHAATAASSADEDTENLRGPLPAARTDSRVLRGDHIDRFTVVEELGAGGMGQVVAAYDPKLDRKVAIKTLRTELFGKASPQATIRLMREARAMAKLSHANVVTVYEVGTIGQQIYVAMELVEGGTLRDWLRDTTRSWSEIVAAFVQAGRGLEAAHAAGLVHRDFKPENVLVDPQSRVKVTDFGLVGTSSRVRDPDQSVPAPDASLKTSLTQTGAVMGTPLYMAPEQHNGEPTDARADQFAFCVALYEALYEHHPFAAESRAELVSKVLGGEIEPAPKRSRVPAWVHDIAIRGMSARPADRFASMIELVSALERDPRARRRKAAMIAGVIAVVAMAAGLIWYQRQGASSTMCRGSEQQLAGVWDAETKREIRAAFAATDRPYAADSFDRAAKRIDVYTEQWVERRTDSCQAVQDRRELSATQLDLRMHCFDTRLQTLTAVAERWRSATEADVDAAIETAFGLPGLARCTDTKALAEAFPLPADEDARKRIHELTERLAKARADHAAGEYRSAETIAAMVVEAAEPLGYPPLLGAALLVQADSATELSKSEQAEQLLRRAIEQAAIAKDDALAAEAWGSLIFALGSEQDRHAEALALRPALEAAISRGGLDEADAAEYIINIARVYERKGELAIALEEYQRALARLEAAGQGHTPLVIALRGSIASLYREFERFDEAEQLQRQMLAEMIELMGPTHSHVGVLHTELGLTLYERGKFEEAEEHLAPALEIFRDSYGERSTKTVTGMGNLGTLAHSKGELDRAEGLLRKALDILGSQLPADHPEMVAPLINLGAVVFDRGDFEQAKQLFARAAEIQLRVAPEHEYTAAILINLALVAQQGDDFDAMLDSSRKALVIVETALTRDHRLAADALTMMGDALVSLNRPREALPHLQRALAIHAKGASATADHGYTEFTLARALWDTNTDRERALELAGSARKRIGDGGDDEAVEEIEQWLKQRGGLR